MFKGILIRLRLVTLLIVVLAIALGWVPTTQSAPLAADATPPHPRLREMIERGEVQLPQMVDQIDAGALRAEGGAAPAALTGPVRALAVLVDFSDKVQTVQATYFDTLIFAVPVTGRGSVRDYFNEVSYGQVDIVTVNLPSVLGWRRAPQTHAYYTNNNYCEGVYPNNCRKLAEDVVDAVNGVVDFSQYDNNGDGYMEPIMLIHAGPGAEYTGSTADMWSHSSYLYNYRNYDGVTINRYVIVPEYWGFTPTANMTIGIFAHEMGHGFWNLPDLYDRDVSSEGIGNWSVMGSGNWNGPSYLGASPAWPDAWTRLKMGYSTATTVAANVTGQSIQQVSSANTGTTFKLANGVLASQEYFLVENRQKTAGKYDEYLPGAGLAIWHIDEAKAATQNDQECESDPHYLCGSTHYEVALEQADGLLEMEKKIDRGDSGDIFPGSTNNRTWNGTSHPESSSWYSSTPTNIGVVNISDSASTMTADLKISSDQPLPTISINDVSVTEGNSGTVNANFTVSLSAPAPGPVTVAWATENGTATAGTDYVAGSGTVSFAAGESTKTVTVAVNGDTTVEPDETFTVNLTSPSGATIADGQGVGTIVNDDLPLPTITGLNPSSGTPGGPGFTLTVNGANFVNGSVVRWNGSNRTTTYVSGTQLTAAITAADIAAAGTASVTVFNPAPGGGTSNTVSFVVGNPVPTITGLNPSSARAGGPGFTLTVNGTGFVPDSVVRLPPRPVRPTTYVSGTQLRVLITAADIAVPGTLSVTVSNPAPGGGTSNAAPFTVGAIRKVYLPVALRSLAVPVLNPIDNADRDGNYTVAWSASANAASYALQEDDNAAFSSPETRYSGSGTSWNATGKPVSTYYYRVQASNPLGTSGWSNTQQVTVGRAGDIVNGNFEAGATGWTQYSSHGWAVITTSFPTGVSPHSGSWGAWLGGVYSDTSHIGQVVTVPPSRPHLAYWHWIASSDSCGYDFGGVIVNSTVVNVYNLCSSTNTGGWVKHTVNLSAYAGQSVSIQIQAETDVSVNSNLFVDDVAFQSTASSLASNDVPDYDPAIASTRPELEGSPQGIANPAGPKRLLGWPLKK